MKLTLTILMFYLVSVNASTYSQNTLLDISVKNGNMIDLIKQIEEKSEFFFYYQKEELGELNDITVEAQDATVMEILDEIIEETSLDYSVVDRYIVLRKINGSRGENFLASARGLIQAQQRAVSGKVTGISGKPLPGVTVVIKGTTQGTVTNSEGEYTLTNIPEESTLVFSFVGMRTQEVEVGTQNIINVLMEEEIIGLEEVVAVGYSSQRRQDISGSIAIVDVEKASVGASQQIGDQLQGRAAGVTVVSSGQPGTAPVLRIRGINTFGSNDPLYIVDGVPTTDINDLNPQDIESLQVLKDASAASIYGSRASNGVIIITSKQGRKTGVEINVSSTTGYTIVRNGDNVWNYLSPIDYARLRWMAIENSGGNPRPDPLYGSGEEPRLPDYIRPAGAMSGEVNEDDYFLIPEYTGGSSQLATFNQIVRANKEGTDWYKEIHRPALTTNNVISASGGGDAGRFFISFNHFDQQGTVIETFNRRTSVRVNTLFNVNDKLRIGENFTGLYNVNPTISTAQTSAIGMSFTQQPIIPVHDIAGNYAGPAGIGSGFNPVALQERSANDRSHRYRMFGNAFAELDFLQNFTVRTSFGGDLSVVDNSSFVYPTYERAENIVQSSHERSTSIGRNWVWSNTLTYNNTFDDIHKLNVLVGHEALLNAGSSVGGSTQDYYSFNPDYVSLSTGSGGKTNYSSQYENALVSYFARVDYNYDDKYIVSGTLRRDGSSRFIEDYRWGMFPAGSVAWRISKESFMEDLTWITDLKIRGGYGVVGNQMGISVDNPHTLFSPHTGQSYYALDGSKSKTELGFRQSRLGNPDARWEKNISGNVGFDANLFDSKLIIMAEYFWKDTKDLLYAVSLPGTMGLASAPSVNVGHVNNRGIDASVETSGSISRDLNYNATLTFSTYKNEIVYIADGIDYFGGSSNYNTLGYPMNSYYGYKREGFWQSQEEIDKADEAAEEIAGTHYQDAAKPGRWKFADTDGDGVITPDDRTILGDPHPDFTYGLSLGLDYKRFDLDLFFYGSQGHEIWAYYKRYLDFYPFLEGGKSHDALYRSWGSYYLEDNKDAILPIQENVASDASTEANNDFFVRDGSFLKLKEIILGYRLPNEIINKIGASNLRVFAQLSNILTITGYDGLDPEIYGMDHATYAHHPVYQIGINVTF